MTTPLVAAAPAPAPSPSPAATDAPGGAERFASALDDAVSRGQDGPRGRERAAETDEVADDRRIALLEHVRELRLALQELEREARMIADERPDLGR